MAGAARPAAGLATQDKTLVWGAVCRGRCGRPSRIDRELEFLPLLAQSIDFQSEKLVAVEAGYRWTPLSGVGLSFSASSTSKLRRIRTTESHPGHFPSLRLDNGIKGETMAGGGGQYSGHAWWRLSLGAATLWKDFHIKDGHNDLADLGSTARTPIISFSRVRISS